MRTRHAAGVLPAGLAGAQTNSERVVGLLRGVNLGSSRRLKMADLRTVVESLGHTEVKTYVQSGNVVFTPTNRSADPIGPAITAALEAAVGIRVGILTRTGAEMAAIVEANPYRREDPTKIVVAFLAAKRQEDPISGLDLSSYAPEGMTVHGTEVYFDLPCGQDRSPLLASLAKVAPDDGRSTSRNWRTVLALTEMCR